MRTPFKIIILLTVLVFVAALGCEVLKDKVKKTETIELEIADKAPLYAIEYNGLSVQALCAAKLMTVDELVGATDYADLWESAKGNLNEIKFRAVSYEIIENISTGGNLYLYLINYEPDPIIDPSVLDQLNIDSTEWIAVNPDDLDAEDRVVRVAIPAGQNITTWADGEFINDGADRLETQFLHFNSEFAFCIGLDMETHAPDLDNLKPDLKISLKAVADLIFTILD